jgi:DNA-binding CsgD family transcriptional regulator
MEFPQAIPHDVSSSPSNLPAHVDMYRAGAASLLVGRHREQALLRTQLERMLEGRAGLVLVGGEGGTGKTALVEAFGHEAAAQGTMLVWGRCYDLTAPPHLGPWAEIFAQMAAHQDQNPPRSDRLLPTARSAGSMSQAALFAQARDTLVAAATRQPHILVLDDLHWADPASLDLLRYLARTLGPARLLILGTYRPEELGRQHSLYALLPVLGHEGRAVRLELRPLTDDDLRALVRMRYSLGGPGEAWLVAYLHERSRGNPLFAAELLRALEEEGVLCHAESGWVLGSIDEIRVPTPLRQIIDRRVARLGPAAHELLTVAAIIGQDVPIPLWQTVGEATEEALANVIERALAARILVEEAAGNGVRFAHAILREALYEGLSLPARQRWHRRIAELLLAAPDRDPDLIASHFRQARDKRAVDWLIEAGDRAQHRFAYSTARERYEAALMLLDNGQADPHARGWLLVRLAWMAEFADPSAGHTALHEAAQIGATTADSLLLIAARYARGVLRCRGQQLRTGLADIAAAVTMLEGRASVERDWRIIEERRGRRTAQHTSPYHAFALGLAVAGRYDEAAAAIERVLADRVPAHPAAEDDSLEVTWSLAVIAAGKGDATMARQAYHRAREEYAGRADMARVALLALEELQWVALPHAADRSAMLRHLADEGETALAGANAVFERVPPPFARLPLLFLSGSWAEARQLAMQVERGGTLFAEIARIARGNIARAQGDATAAWAIVEASLPEAVDSSPGDAPFHYALAMLRLGGLLAIDAGDLVNAQGWLAAHDRWLIWSGATLGRAEGHLSWAMFHRAAGDRALAFAEAERARARAERPRQPLATLASHRLLGELATEAGQVGAGLPHFAAARALADACGAPYELALTLLAEAEARLALKELDEARVLLAEVRAICEPLGAAPAVASATVLGARLATSSPMRLTTRELEVLRLVTEGSTNAAVAARLGLSRRTVDHHLRAIYGKLGVSSRTAAAHIAITHGLI